MDKFQIPVVLKNKVSKWICSDWTLMDWANFFGNNELPFQFGKFENNKDLKMKETDWENARKLVYMTFEQFMKFSERNREFVDVDENWEWCYCPYQYIHQLFNDSEKLKIFDWSHFGFHNQEDSQSTIWVGSKGSFTPGHYDTYGYNLVAQLYGRKRWILFPPSQGQFLYPTRVPYEESSVFSELKLFHLDKSSLVLIKDTLKETTPYIHVLKPGEVLLVPHHWWHFVENYDTSITVNTWVELPSDNYSRLEESLIQLFMGGLFRHRGTMINNVKILEPFNTEHFLKFVWQSFLHVRTILSKDENIKFIQPCDFEELFESSSDKVECISTQELDYEKFLKILANVLCSSSVIHCIIEELYNIEKSFS